MPRTRSLALVERKVQTDISIVIRSSAASQAASKSFEEHIELQSATKCSDIATFERYSELTLTSPHSRARTPLRARHEERERNRITPVQTRDPAHVARERPPRAHEPLSSAPPTEPTESSRSHAHPTRATRAHVHAHTNHLNRPRIVPRVKAE